MFKRLGLILTLFISAQLATAPTTQAIWNRDDVSVTNESYWYDNYVAEDCSTSGGVSNNTEAAEATLTLTEFIDKYAQAAFTIGKQYGIPYEAIIAQAALESGYGRSLLTRQYNNFFGIKAGSNWTGDTVTLNTEEVINGQTVTVSAKFRAYPTAEAGFAGYGQFIHANSRYAAALNFPGDPAKYITAIFNAGYATDPNYVSKNISIQQAVIKYIKEKNLFPPSSTVTPDATIPNETTGTSSSNCPTTSGQASAEIDWEHIYEDSTEIACAEGTTDAGIHDGYHDGKLVKIRLCAIPNFPCSNQECNQFGDGHAVVNSRISGALYKMITDAIAYRDSSANEWGNFDISTNSSFRSMAHQQYLWDTIGPPLAGRPGYSYHQTGLAIDFSFHSNTSAGMYKWLLANGEKYGFYELKNPREPWHWDVRGGV